MEEIKFITVAVCITIVICVVLVSWIVSEKLDRNADKLSRLEERFSDFKKKYVTAENGVVLDSSIAEKVKTVGVHGYSYDEYYPKGEKPPYDKVHTYYSPNKYYKDKVEVTKDGKIVK